MMNGTVEIISFTRRALAALLSAMAFLCAAPSATAQTVIGKNRIGGYAEDIAYVSKGRLKDNIIILDGTEVFAVENAKKPKGSMSRLFDLKVPEINIRPNGITYIESEELFAFNDASQPTKLFLYDDRGEFKGTRTIQYLTSGYAPQHMEGLAYIPANSPSFPDHLVLVVFDTLAFGQVRFEVCRRDGVVVAEIFRTDWPANFTDAGVGDVAFFAPDRLLVTTYDNSLWTMDFSGNILSGPLTVSGANGFEGIVQMKDDRVVAVNYPQSLIFFDKHLTRTPESDRNDVIGLNLNLPSGIAWNSDTDRLLVSYNTALNLNPAIAAAPTSLNSATPFVSLNSFPFSQRLTYLPTEQLLAMTHANSPRAIVLFDSTGAVHSQINLSPAAIGPGLGAPVSITYIPTTNEFAVGFNGVNGDPNQPMERRRLRIFSRTGTLVRTVDLSGTGTNGVGGLTYFDDPGGGGGRFLILGSAGRVFVTDLNGDSRNSGGLLFREFNSRVKLGLLSPTDVTAITSGPLAGAFAVTDRSSGEVVIFRLN